MRRTLEIIEALSPTTMSASSWELFTNMPGVAKASAALNTAMAAAKRDILATLKTPEYKGLRPGPWKENDENTKRVAEVIAGAWNKHVRPVQRRYAEFGAADSEPDYHVRHGLAAVAARFYKLDDESIFVGWM